MTPTRGFDLTASGERDELGIGRYADVESPFGDVEERVFASREEAMAFVAERLGQDEGVEFEVVGDNLIPVDREWLRDNPNLPPQIWEDAPGFLS